MASAKQLAARSKFAVMIKGKKKSSSGKTVKAMKKGKKAR